MDSGLQHGLGQTRKATHEDVFVALQRAAAGLEHALESRLKPAGVTATQLNVLRLLRRAGAPGLCRHEVGARMVCRVPDVTRLLDRLEVTGLITRTRSREDRRHVSTRITPKGLEALATLDEVTARFLKQRMGPLDADQRQSLITLLSLLCHMNT